MSASTKMFRNIPVSMSKFLTIFTIKYDPCCISTVWRNSNLRTCQKKQNYLELSYYWSEPKCYWQPLSYNSIRLLKENTPHALLRFSPQQFGPGPKKLNPVKKNFTLLNWSNTFCFFIHAFPFEQTKRESSSDSRERRGTNYCTFAEFQGLLNQFYW